MRGQRGHAHRDEGSLGGGHRPDGAQELVGPGAIHDPEEGGAGLGLAIADAIVRATGGRWKVASAPAGGARMAISWSRALA